MVGCMVGAYSIEVDAGHNGCMHHWRLHQRLIERFRGDGATKSTRLHASTRSEDLKLLITFPHPSLESFCFPFLSPFSFDLFYNQ